MRTPYIIKLPVPHQFHSDTIETLIGFVSNIYSGSSSMQAKVNLSLQHEGFAKFARYLLDQLDFII